MTDTDTGGLAGVLSNFARSLEAEGNLEDTLRAVVRGAVDTVPGAARGGVSFVEARRRVIPRAPSDEVARELDKLQSELGEGPCLDAVWDQEVVKVPDLATDGRWPRFCSRATELGVGSMLSFRLFVRADTLGALNLFGTAAGAFDAESETIGGLFAAHAAVALVGAEHESHFQLALDSRGLIGQAQGIMMQQSQLTAAQAFARLVAASQRSNTKLVEVAGQIVTAVEQRAGESPAIPKPPR